MTVRRPLTELELTRIADAVARQLHRTQQEHPGPGVVPAVGHAGTGTDHVIVAARAVRTKSPKGGAEAAKARIPDALGHWAQILAAAGFTVERRRRPPVLIVRPQARLTPHELYDAVDARRAALGLSWEDVAAQAQLTHEQLLRFRARAIRRGVRGRLEAWLAAAGGATPPASPVLRAASSRT